MRLWLLLLLFTMPACAQFPWATTNAYNTMEGLSNGVAPTNSTLAAGQSGDAGSWDASVENSLILGATAGQSVWTTGCKTGCDTGVTGMSYDASSGGVGYAEWNLPSAQSHVSMGVWYCTEGNLLPNQEGPHFLTYFNFGAGNLWRASDERSSFTNDRQIRLSPGNNAVIVTDNACYWVTMNYNAGGAVALNVYTPSLTLVGAVTDTDTFGNTVQGILLGNSSATTGRPGQTTYFDNLMVNYTGSTPPYPLLPGVGCDISSSACSVRAGASGAGTGADWTNAYTSLPTNLTRGVTYYVATGTYGRHAFGDADTGTVQIIVQAPTIATHGTATGWSNAYAAPATFTCATTCATTLFSFTTDYYVLNGAYCTLMSGLGTCSSGFGFVGDNSNKNANGCTNGGLGFAGSPIFVHDITVEYLNCNGAHPNSDSDNLDTGVDFEGGSYNLLFQHMYVHDDWVPFYLKGNHKSASGFGTGNNVTIDHTLIQNNFSSPANHAEGCSCSEALTNFTISNSVFDQIGGRGGNGSTAAIATASGASRTTGNGPNGPWNIYGNIYYCTSTATNNCAVGDGFLAIFDADFSAGNVNVLNNTIDDIGPHSLEGYLGLGLSQTTNFAGFVTENNLQSTNAPITVLNNGTTNNGQGATFSPASVNGFNAYYNTTNSDSSGSKQTISSNPYVGSTCCTLSADTTAGTSTHSIVPGNDVDMNGVARGVNGVWDRGALQLSSGGATSATAAGVTVSGAAIQ